MIKALFFDLDGTMITSDGKIAASTKTALKACKVAGLKIFIATGRTPLIKHVLPLTIDEWESLIDGGVFYNGGCILYDGNKRYHTMPDNIAVKVINAINNFPEVNFAIQMVEEKQSFRYELSVDEYRRMGVVTDSLIKFVSHRENEVVKIVVFTDKNLSEDFYKTLQEEIGGLVNVYYVYGGRVIDIVNKNVTKKLAIDQIAEIYNFNADEIAVFGDDYNDIEMLSGYKHSVAMGNACAAAKEIALYTTLSNDADGIYYALKNYLKVI
jgi:Cof subfamily protein (haloacid dehalogenase superfamily)